MANGTHQDHASGSPLVALIERAVKEAIPKYQSGHPDPSAASTFAMGEVLKYTSKACEIHALRLQRCGTAAFPNESDRLHHRNLLVGVLLHPYLSHKTAYAIADRIMAADNTLAA